MFRLSLKCSFVTIILMMYMVSCNGNKELNIDDSKNEIISISPFDLIKQGSDTRINASSIFDTISYVKMERTDSGMFSRLDKVEVFDGKIFILDKNINTLLIFTTEGDFVKSINKVGSEAGHYKEISTFVVDRSEKEIVLFDAKLTKLLFFNFHGRFIREVVPPYFISDFEYLGNNSLGMYRGYYALRGESDKDELTSYNYFIADSLTNIKQKALRYNMDVVKGTDVMFNSRCFYTTPEGTFFVPPYQYNVYNVTSDSIKSKFVVKFPDRNSLPKDFMENAKYNNRRMYFIHSQNELAYSISDFYPVGGKIFMSIMLSGYKGISIVYDKDTKKSIPFTNVVNDINIFPLGNTILAVDSEYVYCAENPETMLGFSKMASEMDTSNKVLKLKADLSRFNETDNPVLVKIKLKIK